MRYSFFQTADKMLYLDDLSQLKRLIFFLEGIIVYNSINFVLGFLIINRNEKKYGVFHMWILNLGVKHHRV